jgi:ligand-binding SRPBCC domain-containing protein
VKVHVLEQEQLVQRPRDEVFAFFDRAENLGRITPAHLGFRLLTPVPLTMKEGAVIDYVVSLGGWPLRWRSYISTYDPPRCFVDEQLTGPYSFWHHTHSFAAVPEGTLVRDSVRYALPLGPFGELVHTLWVRRQLVGIFAHRRRVIAAVFGDAAVPREESQT